MRLVGSDPDVETIISRIDAGDIDLQPDFQRGEVWTKQKKQRLVDSILRNWHVPPIHVVELQESAKQEVLDGQQRLAAIRDFARGQFPIDGTIAPNDANIEPLHGLRFHDLPPDIRRKFNQFTIRVFRIIDYQADEPAELFFRLNQPTNLTSAEQRNAFFGVVRGQIKELVERSLAAGLDKSFLGFSNSRMAYDDVLSRAAFSLERESISEKITSAGLVDFYRGDAEVSAESISTLNWCIETLSRVKEHNRAHPKFNKATFYSWVMFLARARIVGRDAQMTGAVLAAFMEFFVHADISASVGLLDGPEDGAKALEILFPIYSDRATSRVADVSSVLLRDAAIWYAYCHYQAFLESKSIQEFLPSALRSAVPLDSKLDADLMAKNLVDAGWGLLRVS